MKRLALAALLLSLAAAPLAQADPLFEESGTISAPGPTSKVIGGVTEILNPCGEEDPDLGDLQGFDGHWFQVPTTILGKAATLDSDGVDVDVWFYDAGCGLIQPSEDSNAYSMATDGTADEAGTVPAGAAHAIVDNAAGANVSFVFSVA